MSRRRVAIECFSCSGGMAEGFRRAGILFDHVFDKDPNACDSYEQNLGHRPIQMDARDLLRMVRAGWHPGGGVDLFVADPPCTPWSRAGKRQGREDERDMLDDTVELIALLRPRTYLIGNVPGLDDSTQWHIVQDAIGGLSKHGYCVADYVKLNAADYGVPQCRVRPFWFGHLDGPCIQWPAPSHGKVTSSTAFPGYGLAPWVTCRDALSHLSIEDLGRPIRQKWNKKHTGSSSATPAQTITTGAARHQCNTLRIGERPWHNPHPASESDSPARTITTRSRAGGGGGAAVLKINHRLTTADEPAKTLTTNTHSDGSYLEWPWDRPATTVCADPRIAPPGHHRESGSFMSAPNAIALSERAAAILQGFPEDWKFIGATKAARWSQIGQAMPPALAAAVAHSVVEQLERKKVAV